MRITPKELAGYFDNSQMKAYAVQDDFDKLCRASREYGFRMIAINPAPVALCRELLSGSDVHVGAAIGFPLGQTTINDKANETKEAIRNGAD